MEPGSPRLLTNGETIFGRYRLKMLVGKGAMGMVWRAADEELEIDIALKFLGEDFLFDPAAITDLKRETRRGMALAHPNIVRIYGFFQDGGYAAIAMEYVEGNTLATLQAARRQGCFEIEEITDWTRQLCSALHYAHTEAQLVHRDLKPGNLIVDDRGRLKIADFGIAAGLNDAHTRMSGVADTRGTLSYMSPQQLLGQRAGVEHDIYALGATLYDLVTGRPPFFSGDISLQVRTVTPPGLAERRAENGFSGGPIPPAWEETIAACLAKDAAQRPTDAAEVAARLGLGAVAAGNVSSRGSSSRSPMPRGGPPSSSDSAPPGPGAPTVLQASGASKSGTGNRGAGTELAMTPPAATLTKTPVPSGAVPVNHGAELVTRNVARHPLVWLAAGVALTAVLLALGVAGAIWIMRSTQRPERVAQAAPAVAQSDASPRATRPPSLPDESANGPRGPQFGAPGPGGPPGGGPLPGDLPGPNGPGDAAPPPPFELPATPMAELDHPEPEHPFTLPVSQIAMVWLPRGANASGTPSNAPAGPGPDNEAPFTEFVFTEGFWVGKYEVSRAEFAGVMGYLPRGPSASGDTPVANLSWNEAMEFCRRLTERERKAGRLTPDYEYTLPAEMQWEYAAKSGGKGPFGATRNVADAAWGSWRHVSAPQPRGQLQPTPNVGIYDIYGNVSEWCRDWYVDHRPGGRVQDYTGPTSGTEHVVKGGSFADDERGMRAGARSGRGPDDRDPRIGFRLALVRRGLDR